MSLYAMAVWAPVLAAVGVVVAGWATRRRPWVLGAALVVVAAGFALPVAGLPLVAWPRAVLAEPSLGLVGVGLLTIGHRVGGFAWVGGIQAVLHGTVLGLGLALYPLALGLGWFDPYGLGYRPGLPLALALVVAGLWWVPAARGLAALGTVALGVHATGWAESDNLWDLLIDPVGVGLAAGWGLGRLGQRQRGRHVAR